MKPKINYTKPSITDLEIGYATDAAANGWGEHCYDYINRFENLFKNHLSVNFAISTSSCTGALHLGLAGLEIGNGDEVILADTNWIATAAPIVHLGAKPIFVDILPQTWCINPESVKKAITNKTKAIIVTHLYGNLCSMDQLLEIGKNYGLPIIEDAAEAIGSVYRGKRAGSMGRFSTFSFHGSKTMTTGEGGMFVTNDEILFEQVLALSNHGRSRKQTKQFWPDMVGLKYKMSNVQAAIGLAQLQRIDILIARKREIFAYYKQALDGIVGVNLNIEENENFNGYWMPNIVFDYHLGISRERLQEAFTSENIDARVFFWPLSSLPFFAPCISNKVAWDIPNRAINLPSFHDINFDEQDRVISVIKKLLYG